MPCPRYAGCTYRSSSHRPGRREERRESWEKQGKTYNFAVQPRQRAHRRPAARRTARRPARPPSRCRALLSFSYSASSRISPWIAATSSARRRSDRRRRRVMGRAGRGSRGRARSRRARRRAASVPQRSKPARANSARLGALWPKTKASSVASPSDGACASAWSSEGPRMAAPPGGGRRVDAELGGPVVGRAPVERAHRQPRLDRRRPPVHTQSGRRAGSNSRNQRLARRNGHRLGVRRRHAGRESTRCKSRRSAANQRLARGAA